MEFIRNVLAFAGALGTIGVVIMVVACISAPNMDEMEDGK